MPVAVVWSMLALEILVLIAAVVWTKFTYALHSHLVRINHGSQIVPSPFGQIEFARVGNGEPLLVIHGAGGGFDQVLCAATRLIAAGYQIIAPSRFGYLRSNNPIDPSPENQAAAYVSLLDALGIESVPVIGISAGALSALCFALYYPKRCRSLTVIVPAVTSVGNALPTQGRLPEQGWLSRALTHFLLRSDFLFWLGINVARKRIIRSVLATDPALVAEADAEEQERAYRILDNILPLSRRSQGLLNDALYTSTPQSIALDQIHVPALVISLEDDYYHTISAARFIAAKIPSARLVTYTVGGHVWIGHDAELFGTVTAFLTENKRSLPWSGPNKVRRTA